MKKSIVSFFCDKNSATEGWLKEWHIVEDTISKLSTIKARVLCIDNIERWFEYSVSQFEYIWEINIDEIELPNINELRFLTI